MGDASTVLVTGAAGQVGAALRPIIPGADFRSREQLDVTDAGAVARATLGKTSIVHTAAFTDVDACEADPDRAWLINTEGTRNLVEAARACGARVLYISTDYVFSGDDAPYSEDDEPNPLNTYGETKLGGERFLDEAAGDLVLRTSWIFGKGRNFVRTILGAAQRGSIAVVGDQIGRPTPAEGVAAAIGWLLEQHITGVLNVAGDGAPCSWADLAEASLREATTDAVVERIDTATHVASSSKLVARRPANSTLSLDRARSLGVPLLDWRFSLGPYVRSLL